MAENYLSTRIGETSQKEVLRTALKHFLWRNYYVDTIF